MQEETGFSLQKLDATIKSSVIYVKASWPAAHTTKFSVSRIPAGNSSSAKKASGFINKPREKEV